MKKVWMEIKVEFAYGVMNLWYHACVYIVKHGKSFSKPYKEFARGRYTFWVKRFVSLYDELEAIEH